MWVLGLSYVVFATLLSFSSYVAAMPLLKEEWGLSNTQAGTIFSLGLAGYGIGSLVILPLTDRVGPKPILLSLAVVSVTSHLLFPLLAHGMASASVLRLFHGLGFLGVYVPGLRIVADRMPAGGRGLALGTLVTASYAGTALSLIYTGALMSALDWRLSYLIVAGTTVTAIPVAFALLSGYRHRPSASTAGGLDLTVLKSEAVRLVILGYTLHAAELYVGRVWLPAFLLATLVAGGTAEADATVLAATVGGVALGAGALGPVIGGGLSDRFGRARTAALIFAASGVTLATLGWLFGGPWGVIVAVAVIFGWATAADSAIYTTAVTEVTDPAKLGSTLAIHSSIGFTGGVIGPIAFGGVLDLIDGSYRWGVGFTATGLLAVIAIAAMARVRSLPESRRMASGRR